MLDFGGWILDLKIPLAFGSQASYHTPQAQRTRRQRGLHIIFMRYRGTHRKNLLPAPKSRGVSSGISFAIMASAGSGTLKLYLVHRKL